MILNTLEIIPFSVLIFCFIFQLLFYWMVLAKPYYHIHRIANGKIKLPEAQPPVSIIVSVKNSDYNLLEFLQGILEQEYPEFEVIIVTDGISDENEEIIIRLKNQYPNLYSTHVPEDTKNVSRKKLALTLGIKAAKYNTLLFTEPDSCVRSSLWISLMSRHFARNKTIVLGFIALKKKKGLFNKFMAYDYLFSNLQMISLALFNHPYIGDGRNLAYSKNHFIEQKGFVKYRIIQQGEDDLFINEIATKENTAIELSAQSVMIAEINNIQDWKHQKIDRASTKHFYKRGPVALWRLEAFFRIGFIASFIACLTCGGPYSSLSNFLLPGIAFFCFLLRFFSQLFVINNIADRLQLEKYYLTIPFFDLFQPLINMYFYAYSVLKGKENYTYRYEKR